MTWEGAAYPRPREIFTLGPQVSLAPAPPSPPPPPQAAGSLRAGVLNALEVQKRSCGLSFCPTFASGPKERGGFLF